MKLFHQQSFARIVKKLVAMTVSGPFPAEIKRPIWLQHLRIKRYWGESTYTEKTLAGLPSASFGYWEKKVIKFVRAYIVLLDQWALLGIQAVQINFSAIQNTKNLIRGISKQLNMFHLYLGANIK